MMAFDAIAPIDRGPRKWTASWDLLFEMLLALVRSEHSYAYLVATERPPSSPRA
jgi:hypothetical protein